MSNGRSITTRLIIMLSLCSALVVGTGMLADYFLSRQQILARLELEANEAISAAILDLEHWLGGVEGSTLLLARILQQRDYSRPGLAQMLRDVVGNNRDIFGAAIALAPTGQDNSGGFAPYYYRHDGVITYANLAGPEHNYQRQAWYTDTVAAGKPVWIEPYYDEGGGEVAMTTFAVPVYRETD
ncbi:MAG: cache domain-containing protein, partial [Gammaproteobacteria bacterium]|nr:cache domain-containing protein [Gammaproteobacteria bacterium]